MLVEIHLIHLHSVQHLQLQVVTILQEITALILHQQIQHHLKILTTITQQPQQQSKKQLQLLPMMNQKMNLINQNNMKLLILFYF